MTQLDEAIIDTVDKPYEKLVASTEATSWHENISDKYAPYLRVDYEYCYMGHDLI